MVLFALTTLAISADKLALWIGIVTGGGGIAVGLWKVGKALVTFAKRISALIDLADHELNHNSGSSVKDKAYDAARDSAQALDLAKGIREDVSQLNSTLASYTESAAAEHVALWQAIGGLRDAS